MDGLCHQKRRSTFQSGQLGRECRDDQERSSPPVPVIGGSLVSLFFTLIVMFAMVESRNGKSIRLGLSAEEAGGNCGDFEDRQKSSMAWMSRQLNVKGVLPDHVDIHHI